MSNKNKLNVQDLLVALTIGVLVGIAGLYATTGSIITGLLSVAGVLVLLNIIVNPKAGIIFLIIVSSLDVLGRLLKLPGVGNITVFHIIFLVFLLSCILRIMWKERLKITVNPVVGLVIVFLFMSSVSLFYSPNMTVGLVDLIRLAALIFIFLVIVNMDYDYRDFIKLRNTIIWLGLANVLIAYYQVVFSKSLFSEARIAFSGFNIMRAAGLFFDPNKFGAFLMMIFVILLALLLNNRKKLKYFIILIMVSIPLLLTFSRSAWLGTAFGSFIVIMSKKGLIKKMKWVTVVVAVFVVVVMFVPGIKRFVVYRFDSLVNVKQEDSINTRKNMIKSSINMFIDYPLGIGWRGYPVTYKKYIIPGTRMKRTKHGYRHILESHSLPFTILVEFGVFGVVWAILLFITMIKFSYSSFSRINNNELKTLYLGLMAAWWAFMLDFCFYSDLFDNYFWIIFGLLIALGKWKGKEGLANNESTDSIPHVSQQRGG